MLLSTNVPLPIVSDAPASEMPPGEPGSASALPFLLITCGPQICAAEDPLSTNPTVEWPSIVVTASCPSESTVEINAMEEAPPTQIPVLPLLWMWNALQSVAQAASLITNPSLLFSIKPGEVASFP
jgi:hypothetical protein